MSDAPLKPIDLGRMLMRAYSDACGRNEEECAGEAFMRVLNQVTVIHYGLDCGMADETEVYARDDG
jgi:hypothetical protein